MADRLAGELDRLYKAIGEPGTTTLVFADPVTGEPLDKAADPPPLPQGAQGRGARPTYNLHGLRHTFGTRMAAAGVPMRTCRSGWAPGHSTTQRYADYAPSQHESALMERAWAAETGPKVASVAI